MNVGSVLTRAAAAAPDHPAICYGDLVRSYAEFNIRANRLASAFRAAGIGRGNRIAILQRNCPELLETLFATLKCGAVTVPMNARMHPKEAAYVLQDSGARVLVFTDDMASGLDTVRAELPGVEKFVCIGSCPDWAVPFETLLAGGSPENADAECADEDIAWLFYTSGTTGKPKGAMDSHGNLRFMIDQYPREIYQLKPDDIVMHPGPLTHGSGLWALAIIAEAGTNLIPDTASFDPERIFQLIEKHRVTKIAFIAPTMITMLLNAPSIDRYDLASLRFIGYGGSPMYAEDLKRALRQWGPILCQIYGQGETPMTITTLTPEEHRIACENPALERRLTSAGRIREGIEIAILDDADQPLGDEQIGEICLRGPSVMKGYWNKPQANEEAFRNGWYHTGDLGLRDADGFYYLLDRKKELIITGGANVYPREVEEVLLLHPDVLEVAVIGVPDRLWGESVMAVIRLRPGAKPDEKALLDLCRDHLAGYKKPRFFRFEDNLPKSGYGKILKRELKARIIAETEAST